MRNILFEFELYPTTWVYLSSLITIAVYFKFRRLWSVRNLDLIALIVYSPGLLLLAKGQERLGYVWLFGVGGFFLVRLLLDTVMVRRPLLEPNLSAGGLTFACVALLVFLMTNVITEEFPRDASESSQPTVETGIHEEHDEEHEAEPPSSLWRRGPGYPPFLFFAGFADGVKQQPPEAWDSALLREAATKGAVVLGYLVLVAGVVLIGYRHFDNIQTGVAVASLYLLLPYTWQMTSRVDHVIPAAVLVWAVATYRRPMIAGIFMGLAGGLVYYPLYILPLWCGFYWRRGLIRFLAGVLAALLVLVGLLLADYVGLGSFEIQLQQMFGLMNPLETKPVGFWQNHDPLFRMPVLAAFVAICGGLALWPAQKNLGTLLSCSAAVMLGSQFWQAYQGGTYMAWYLPLMLLTIFRPNLEDRVAVTAVIESWARRRKKRPVAPEKPG